MIPISLGLLPAVDIMRNVSYTLRLKALGISLSLGGSISAVSTAYIRKYSKVFGILWTSIGVGEGLLCIFAASSTVAILQIPIPRVGSGSKFGLAGVPGI
jgi:hypothetical protein